MSQRHPVTFDSHFDPHSTGVNYGVLRGKVIRFGTEDGTPSPHFQIIVQDTVPRIWRVAVNVRSDDGSNDQAAVKDPLVGHPILDALEGIAQGYTPLPNHVSGQSLDFVRQPLFSAADLKVLPPFGSGSSGLEDVLSELTQNAIDGAAAGVELFVWGSRFDVGDHPVAADITYGDKVGIHDVHMNQGNPPPHERDNGIFQDGGLLFRFSDRCIGVFMKFQSQVGVDDSGNVVLPAGPASGAG
jgi:uncharacterized protein YukJ